MKIKITHDFILTGLILMSCPSAYAAEPLLKVNTLSNTDIVVLKKDILEEYFDPTTNQDTLSSREEHRIAISNYQDAIDGLKASHGAYHYEVSEQLLELGLAYSNQASHRKANEVFNQALHIQRINE